MLSTEKIMCCIRVGCKNHDRKNTEGRQGGFRVGLNHRMELVNIFPDKLTLSGFRALCALNLLWLGGIYLYLPASLSDH